MVKNSYFFKIIRLWGGHFWPLAVFRENATAKRPIKEVPNLISQRRPFIRASNVPRKCGTFFELNQEQSWNPESELKFWMNQ